MNLTAQVYDCITKSAVANDRELALEISNFNGDLGAFNSRLGDTDYALIHHLIARNLWRSALSLQAKIQTNIIDCYEPAYVKLHIPTFLTLLNTSGLLETTTFVEILAFMVAVKLANQGSSFFSDRDIARIRLEHLDDLDDQA